MDTGVALCALHKFAVGVCHSASSDVLVIVERGQMWLFGLCPKSQSEGPEYIDVAFWTGVPKSQIDNVNDWDTSKGIVFMSTETVTNKIVTNKTIEQLMNHVSIRSYSDQPVPDEMIHTIIKSMQAAPNWCNLQHVSVVAVKDPVRRKRMSELCGGQPYVAEVPVFLVFCGDFYRTSLACQTDGEDFDFVTTQTDNLIVVSNKAGIAVGTAVVAAESMGLGTVPIGDVRLHARELVKELKLPKYVAPLIGLCVGYAKDDKPPVRPRLPLNAVYFEEEYNTDLSGLLQKYDETYGEYLKKRPWFSKVDNFTQLAQGFYHQPYNHYPEVELMLVEQGYWAKGEQ